MLSRSKAKRKAHFEKTRTLLTEKIRESMISVLPIIAIVAVLCLFLVPMQPTLLLTFLVGALMIVVGLGLFSLGADRSMTIIGSKIGTALTKIGKLPVILLVAFALGVAVTVAEPDLQVLADTVPNIDKTVLLAAVGVGVGFFMVVCMLRILYGINLRWVLVACYIAVFLLAVFTDRDFLGIAFDSGGVTTGPMTVPFILALGVGISHVRSDKRAEADSFGLVALCSIGPILSVLLLGFFGDGGGSAAEITQVSFDSTTGIGTAFLAGAAGIYEGDGHGHAAYCGYFPDLPGICIQDEHKKLRKDRRGYPVYLCGLGAVSGGSERGLFQPGGGAGGGPGYRRNGMAADPAGGAAGLVHHRGGACGGMCWNKQVEEVSAGAIPGRGHEG